MYDNCCCYDSPVCFSSDRGDGDLQRAHAPAEPALFRAGLLRHGARPSAHSGQGADHVRQAARRAGSSHAVPVHRTQRKTRDRAKIYVPAAHTNNGLVISGGGGRNSAQKGGSLERLSVESNAFKEMGRARARVGADQPPGRS